MATKLNREWKEEPLSTYVDIKGGNGFPLKFQDKDSDIAFLKVSDLGERDGQKSLVKASHTISQKNNEMLKAKIYPANSIIFAKIGAAVFLERKRILSFNACIDNNLAVILPSSNIDIDFLYYLLASYNISDHVTATALPSINIKDFLSSTHRFPEKPEQKAIAKALSEIDELIAITNNEIKKYIDLFDSMSDNLLNPLKNLESKFDVRRLGDLAEIVPGGTPSTAIPEFWNGDILWATPTDITATKGKYIAITKRKISLSGLKHASKILPIGSILLCTRATIGESKIALSPITTNQGFKNLVPFGGVNNQWLYYVLKTKIDEMKSLSSGSTFLELGTKSLANIEISTPSSEKQIEFGKILSDVDDLIDAFSLELAKYECIKQGMAHDLLTGKVRLV